VHQASKPGLRVVVVTAAADEPGRHEEVELGGEAACRAHLVCPECGRMATGEQPEVCEDCGAELPD
jgi:rubrerythrin